MIHWLEIGGMNKSLDEEKKQWLILNEYLNKYKDSSYNIYIKNNGDVYKRVIKLKSAQNYNDLDLDCNSLFNGSIKRLDSKPIGIEEINKKIEFFINRS